MTRKRATLALFPLTALVLLSPASSGAEWTVRGAATTVLESYESPVNGEAALPLYQYFRLDLRETDDRKERVGLYGRVAGDLNDEVDADSRLYFAYYDRKDLFEGIDLRAGRQWINTVAGSPFIDGLRVTAGKSGLFRLTVYGGGYVTIEGDEDDDLVWGFDVRDDLWKGTDLSASYLQKRTDGDLDREILGLSGRTRVAGRGSAYAELQYDMLSRISSYYLAGIRLTPADRFTLKAEYLGYTPVFDSTSIYSVFAVDEYQEATVSADYRLDRRWTVFGSYTREFYESFDDANVFEAGCELRKPGGYGGYVVLVNRTGEEDLRGIKVDYRTPAPWDIWLDIGAEYNVYSRLDDEEDDTTAKRYWLQGRRDLSEATTLSAKVERIESIVYDYYNRGRIRFQYRF